MHATRDLERQRRATDAREEAPPPSQLEPFEPSMSAHVPSSPLSQIERMAGTVVTMGRWVNFKFFDDNEFVFGQ